MAYYTFACPNCNTDQEEFITVSAWYQEAKRDDIDQDLTICDACGVTIGYIFNTETHEIEAEAKPTHPALRTD